MSGDEVSVEASDRFVAVPGGDVFVRQWRLDEEDRAPIILLHDSLGSVEQWRDFPEALAVATGRGVIAYDRLGFGRSTRRAVPMQAGFIDDEARVYVPTLADALGLGEYVLFGHSVGGGMALVAAAVPGNDCVAVITEAAQAFVEARTLTGIREAKKAFADESRFARLERWHGERARWVLTAWTEVWLSPRFRDWSLDPYLDKVRCPVLAIHGDADEFGSGEFPRRIAQGVSGPAREAILDDCGHVPHRERRDHVLALVAAFLEENRVP
ncbi:hydrolase-like protein [Salinisphaera sp. PC39]